MSLKITCPFILVLLLLSSCSSSEEEKIRLSVKSQLQIYPASTLQDLYKNFFQDHFGPEHAIRDTAAARQWLEFELETFNQSNNPDIEILGTNQRYIRVNLSLIKQGKISEQQLLEAFINSAKKIDDNDIAQWGLEWQKIVDVIQKMNLQINDFEMDKKNIEHLLNNGKYAVHHSAVFNELYQPHYRIVEKEIYEGKIKPFIE
jgi:hypothetical protein